MKAFFERYSYDCVRMMLTQIVIALFGFALAVAAANMDSEVLLLWASIAAAVFYLSLIFGRAWRVGTRDMNSVKLGKLSNHRWTGLCMSLVANAVNWILAIVIACVTFIGSSDSAGPVRAIALMFNGFYQGILATVKIGDSYLNGFWWVYFLLPVPALVISTVGYLAGADDWAISKLLAGKKTGTDMKEKQK